MSADLKRERRLLAAVGAALAVSGLLRYTTENELTHLDIGLLIAGGVLILASIAMSYRELKSFSGQRSAKLGTNTLTLDHHCPGHIRSRELFRLSPSCPLGSHHRKALHPFGSNAQRLEGLEN